MFYITNTIDHYDNVQVYRDGFGAGFSSGRWFLSILERLLKNLGLTYNIPFLNVIIALTFLLISAVLVVHILQIEDPKLCFCIGAITSSISVVGGTIFFSFTVHVYFLSVLLGTLGVYLAMARRWLRFFSPVLFAFSMGIYQGYFPFFGTLLVLVLIRDTFDNEISWIDIVKKSFFYLAMLLLGCALYMCLNRFFLTYMHITLTDYQGINEMGKLNFTELITLIVKSYTEFTRLFTDGYCGFSTMPLVKLCLAFNFVFVALFVAIDWKNRNLLKNLELCILILLLPLAANSIVIMAPKGYIHILMLYGFVSLFYLPILMAQNLKSFSFRRVAIILVCLTTFLSSIGYTYQDNANYRSLYYSNRQMENYYSRLLTQARSIEGYNEDMEIVLTHHTIYDSSICEPFNQEIYHLAVANPDIWITLNAYSRNRFIYQYFGHVTRDATDEELAQYAPILDEMPSYPNSGSIRIIDSKVIVKCGK